MKDDYKILLNLLLYEGIWDKWVLEIKDIEFIPEMGGRNGIDEIEISEKIRNDLISRIPEIGGWQTVLKEYIEDVDLWNFVRQVIKHNEMTKKL